MANPFDRSKWENWHTRTEEAKERDLKAGYALAEFNTGVALGILLPFTPINSLYQGEDPQKIVAQSGGSAIITWLMINALGGAELGAVQMTRSLATRAVVSAATPVVPVVAAGYVTDKYIGFLEEHQPEEPTHQPSFWNSIASAMAGTFGGIQY